MNKSFYEKGEIEVMEKIKNHISVKYKEFIPFVNTFIKKYLGYYFFQKNISN